MNQRAVGGRDTGDIQAGARCVSGRDSVVAAAGRREGELLVGAVQPIPQLHLRAIDRAPGTDLNSSAALDANDGVLVVAAVGHGPTLIIGTQVGPLMNLGSVGSALARGVHRLAAVAGDDAIGSIGDRAATGVQRWACA